MLATRRLVYTTQQSLPLGQAAPRNSRIRNYSDDAEKDNRASAKLFEDAAREEAAERAASSRSSRLTALENQTENWTGEESMQDAVLRMLVDKYKPLRSGPIRTADEKLKQAPPTVGDPPSAASGASAGGSSAWDPQQAERARSMANVPLLPSIEGHQPWHTKFTVPSHASASVKFGNIPPVSSPRSSPSSVAQDERARRQERENKKRALQAGRLVRAKESTIDYKLGMKNATASPRRPNPLTLKGWASLVEERIEKARLDGHFKSVKGRGEPLKKTVEESNPFIGREEFLMNRIVQKNNAAPPWVEIQGELESAVSSFREIMKQSWTRRAIRMLTASRPAALLPKLTLADVTAFRDAEWEARERSYHDTALAELNSLVRKYNGLAPYPVRRAYYSRDAELDRAYRESGEDILRGLAERASGRAANLQGAQSFDDLDEGVHPIADSSKSGTGDILRLRDVLRRWLARMFGG